MKELFVFKRVNAINLAGVPSSWRTEYSIKPFLQGEQPWRIIRIPDQWRFFIKQDNPTRETILIRDPKGQLYPLARIFYDSPDPRIRALIPKPLPKSPQGEESI